MQKPSWAQKFAAAFYGLYLGVTTERSFYVHGPVAMLVVAAGCYFHVTNTEWCLLIFAITQVLAMELCNSALERLAKVITREMNPLIGAALDIAAAAVLVATFGSVAVGLIVFLPHAMRLLGRV